MLTGAIVANAGAVGHIAAAAAAAGEAAAASAVKRGQVMVLWMAAELWYLLLGGS